MRQKITGEKLKKIFLYCFFLLTLCTVIVTMENELKARGKLSLLKENTSESGGFRAQYFNETFVKAAHEFSLKEKISLAEVMEVYGLENKFDLRNFAEKKIRKKDYEKQLEKWGRKEREYTDLLKSYEQIWADVQYFPVPESTKTKEAVVTYEDSWLFERNYGGKRGHEGTDLMAGMQKRDYYPIVSMTDGVIENIGWLDKGGYRIGVRAPSGGYFYYAHLSSYAQEFTKGEKVQAGQMIGYMGDTGYGKEGTTGQFPIHLHVGIYIATPKIPELSVNPYWIMKYLERKKLNYEF